MAEMEKRVARKQVTWGNQAPACWRGSGGWDNVCRALERGIILAVILCRIRAVIVSSYFGFLEFSCTWQKADLCVTAWG